MCVCVCVCVCVFIYIHGVIGIEKGVFGSLSTTVANFTLYILEYIYYTYIIERYNPQLFLLFFDEDGIGIKYPPPQFDMPLNKET